MNQKLKKKLRNQKVEISHKELMKVKDGATLEAAAIINIIPLMVLRDKFGFGHVRLDRYLKYMSEAVKDFNEGRFNLKDVADMIEAETGVKAVNELAEDK